MRARGKNKFRLLACLFAALMPSCSPPSSKFRVWDYASAISVVPENTEQYDQIYENDFQEVASNPLSTFSIDVDTASYSNMRRSINDGELPPKDAVRIEEFINYFNYSYPEPKGKEPFSVFTELADCPWAPDNKLLRVGLRGREITENHSQGSNLVFLLDVSGSMYSADKLPLLKKAFRLLVNQLSSKDRISIVTYAGAGGLVLEPTSGQEKEKIIDALGRLQAGGRTAGAAGIELAYRTAEENFMIGGNNRVILATDGDFNVGISRDSELVELIEKKKAKGVYLSVLGFGSGNLKDSKMEKLASKGNGNYFYIDNVLEAKKVLVREIGGTLFTIAKDVKLQIEFNPAHVQAYRLIGYENRLLNARDFNDDQKDAGELGSGHTVTALYELVPLNSKRYKPAVDSLKYTDKTIVDPTNQELFTLKLRYKNPSESKSHLIVHTLQNSTKAFESSTPDFKFSTAVAAFGMLLRGSKHVGQGNFFQVLELAQQGRGEDPNGYRAEFIRLVESASLLASSSRGERDSPVPSLN